MNNFHDIYIKNLSKHVFSYTYHNKPRDEKQYERIFTVNKLSNPIERCVYSETRKANIVFLFAEFLWYFSGRDDLDFISYYSSKMTSYSMDGQKLTGTAYGTKIQEVLQNGSSALDTICEMLIDDKDTKRAVLSFYNDRELGISNNIDVSCTLGEQFLLRNRCLNAIVYMRSNDAFVGFLSDVFSFTMIQEFVATRIGARIGTYTHVTGSSHIFESNFQRAQETIANAKPFSSYNLHFPSMPKENNTNSVKTVLDLEEKLRKNKTSLTLKAIEQTNLPKYWQDVISLFELYREHVNHLNINQDIVRSLNPALRFMFSLKFL
jgi:thymidylate synthase